MTEVGAKPVWTRADTGEKFTQRQHDLPPKKPGRFATALAPTILAAREKIDGVKDAWSTLRGRQKAALGRLNGDENIPSREDGFAALRDKGPITMPPKSPQGPAK